MKRKITIDTTHEIINRGAAGTGPISRPAGQNAEGDDIGKGAKVGMKWAPIGHKMTCFRPHTHRYVLTDHGRLAITALLAARNANALELAKLAA